MLRELRRLPEARAVLDAGVRDARRVYRDPHPALATILNNLALVEQDQKDYAGAETHFREVLQIDRAVSGERHADVASDLHNLAWFLHKYRGRSAEGEALARQAVAMRRDLLGPRHPQTLASMRQLGDILSGRGQFAAALPLYREALRVQTEVLPKGHRLTLLSALGLGEALTALGQRDRGDPDPRTGAGAGTGGDAAVQAADRPRGGAGQGAHAGRRRAPRGR